MIQYNLLSVAKRSSHCESLGELSRNTKAETIHLTVTEQLWQIIVEVLADFAEILEIDTELLMEKLITENEKLVKLINYRTLFQAG